jgi:tRNA1Val (adenine37-N6)-methyltransferase
MRKKNTYFQFKQFTIHQEKTAMKVCTDSCLLGALARPGIKDKILDIGTGTGLIALMLAQKTESKIIGIELDEAAAKEAKTNTLLSPWAGRVEIVNQAFQQYAKEQLSNSFDFIISNPPFFTNNLLSGNKSVDLALHSTGLSFGELAEGVARLLKPSGVFVYLLPVYESGKLIEILKTVNLFPNSIFQIYEKPDKPAMRQVVVCSSNSDKLSFTELYIRDSDGEYSNQFKLLLKDYYLNF